MNSLLTDLSKDVLKRAKSIEYDLDRRFINFKEFVDLLKWIFGKSAFFKEFELFGDHLKVFLRGLEIIFDTEQKIQKILCVFDNDSHAARCIRNDVPKSFIRPEHTELIVLLSHGIHDYLIVVIETIVLVVEKFG